MSDAERRRLLDLLAASGFVWLDPRVRIFHMKDVIVGKLGLAAAAPVAGSES